MRSLLLAFVALVVGAVGCGPEFAVIPRGGLDRVTGQQNGVTLTAFANQWDADPYDLPDYVTPIAIELYNPGPYDVRVSYADIALRDSSGFRYAAINPYIPANTLGAAPLLPDAAHAANDGVAPAGLDAAGEGDLVTLPPEPVLFAGPIVLANAGVRVGAPSGVRVGPPAGVRMGPPGGGVRVGPPAGGGVRVGPPGYHYSSPAYRGGYYRGGVVVGAPGVRRWGWGGGWSGYRVYGGLRPYYGWGVGYWGGPWFYPPYYNDWVFWWGPSYYPSRPSTDVLELGLPEGVLSPGGRVTGYVYFKRATGSRQGALDLSWDLHDARTGTGLGTVHVPLEVVRR